MSNFFCFGNGKFAVSKLSMNTRHLFALGALLAVVSVLTGCSPAPTGTWQGYIEGEYVYVAPPLGGALTHLTVTRGDSVKTGQPLFELERQSEAATVAQAEKDLAQAQAQLADLHKVQGSLSTQVLAHQEP